MAKTELTDTPWLDILPPPAPLDHSLLFTLMVIGVVVLAVAGLYAVWQRRPRQRARRRLRRLLQQLDADQVNSKHALFELNRLLCNGLGLTRLGDFTASSSEHWQGFYQRLQQAQYQAAAPERAHARQLLNEAADWLKRGRA